MVMPYGWHLDKQCDLLLCPLKQMWTFMIIIYIKKKQTWHSRLSRFHGLDISTDSFTVFQHFVGESTPQKDRMNKPFVEGPVCRSTVVLFESVSFTQLSLFAKGWSVISVGENTPVLPFFFFFGVFSPALL